MSKKSNNILQDHKQIGKKFIPPAKYRIQNLEEVYWSNDILPEMVWIAIINEKFGTKRAVEIISSFIWNLFLLPWFVKIIKSGAGDKFSLLLAHVVIASITFVFVGRSSTPVWLVS